MESRQISPLTMQVAEMIRSQTRGTGSLFCVVTSPVMQRRQQRVKVERKGGVRDRESQRESETQRETKRERHREQTESRHTES